MAIRVLQSTVNNTMADMKKNLQELGLLQQEKLARQESYDAMQQYKDRMAQAQHKSRQWNAALDYGQSLPEDQRPGYMRELHKRMYNAPMGEVPDFSDMMGGSWKPPTLPNLVPQGNTPSPTSTAPAPSPTPVGNPAFTQPERTPEDWGKVAGSYLQSDPAFMMPDTQDALRKANPNGSMIQSYENLTGKAWGTGAPLK